MRSFIIFSLMLALLTSWGASTAQAQPKEADRLKSSASVLNEIMATPDKSIPTDLLTKCACVAVIPSMKKVGFIFGGRYGRGVVSCRKSHGGWGPLSMVTLAPRGTIGAAGERARGQIDRAIAVRSAKGRSVYHGGSPRVFLTFNQ